MFWNGAINLIKSLKGSIVKHVIRVLNYTPQKFKNKRRTSKLKAEK